MILFIVKLFANYLAFTLSGIVIKYTWMHPIIFKNEFTNTNLNNGIVRYNLETSHNFYIKDLKKLYIYIYI